MRLWFETWFANVVLGSRDSVVLETWFEKDIRKDMRLWFETWFAKVVLDSGDSVALETWFTKDIRRDMRLRFATDVRIDIRADARTYMRTALEHAPLLSRGLRGNQDGEAVGRALAHSGRGLLQAASPCC
jgi:hypothetical protein